MAWFKDRINHYAKLLGIKKDVRYYVIRRRYPSIILLPAWLSARPESAIMTMWVGPGIIGCCGNTVQVKERIIKRCRRVFIG